MSSERIRNDKRRSDLLFGHVTFRLADHMAKRQLRANTIAPTQHHEHFSELTTAKLQNYF